MKTRDYIAAALYALPTLAGCVGVIVGGYTMLCTAPMWIDDVSAFASDALCAAVCGIGAGLVLSVSIALGGAIRRRKADEETALVGRDGMYIGREVIYRTVRGGCHAER